jgi:Bifunctional DNA primase/polymerase, N-terminal
MPDRLPIVLRWVQQGCRPIPCQAGTKHARDSWTRFQRRDPTVHDRHRWWTGTRQNNENVALILGPPPGGNLLVLNVNVKNGHDGPATLRRLGWIIPPTPTIATPSGGLAHCFKVPDPTIYAFPFGTHVHPPGYEGLEFRGAKGYQLVPTSRTPKGRYEFVPPWTLDRFRADLAELPGAILQAWVQLDRGAKIFARDEPVIVSQTRQHASTATLPTTPHPPQPRPQKRSQARPPQKPKSPPPNTTTITTVLTADNDRVFVDGFDLRERVCAEVLCGRMDLSVDSLDDGRSFHCRLPGHGPDRDPSASWYKSPLGYYLYADYHQRSGDRSYTVPEVFAALTSRVVKRLPDPSRMAWRLRLMVEEGWLTPEPVPMKPVPDDASDLLRHYCEGFRFLIACRSCHPKTATPAAPFTQSFAATWCGLPKGSMWALQQEAIQRDLLVFAGIYEKQALYRPGKDE